MKPMKVSVGITGASGVRIALRLLHYMRLLRIEIYGIIVTRTAKLVAEVEEGLSESEFLKLLESYSIVYDDEDYNSPLASSSNQPEAMVIVPASTKTIALIANGIASGLLSRAALSILRLRRKLVIAPRESPLGVLELRNLYRLALSGAVIVPITLAFYSNPKSIDDVVDFNVGKILDALGVDHSIYEKWRGVRK